MRRRFRAIVPIVIVLALFTAACHETVNPAARSCAPNGTVAHRDLRYASSPGVAAGLQSLDLYLPLRPAGCAAAPIVAYVHGGGFRQGDKANQLTNKINLFNQAGWGLASLNYRLVGNPGSGATDGVYPAPEHDIAAGIGYLANHASEYGLDARRIMLLGHSAGAFLVSLVSTDGSFLQAAGRRLSDVLCTAPLDTTYDIPIQVAGGGTNAAMYRNAFGDDPAVWAQGSPNRNVTAGKGIPSFHVVTRGTQDRVSEAQAFGSVLRDAGIVADVQVATGLSHEEANDSVGTPGESVVTPALMAFFQGCANP